LHAKNDAYDALHVTEPLRVQVVSHLDVSVVPPGDLEGEACGCELNEPQAEVAGVGIVIVGLDVADAAVIILKLTLNDKIGVIWSGQIEVIVAGGLRLPMISEIREFAEAGGLATYGASRADLWRRSAAYVDKIARGAKPGDLPVEQPTRFELVVNLNTAKAIGLDIAPTLLARADEVIE
jgi:ABC transporter substrate binding protein